MIRYTEEKFSSIIDEIPTLVGSHWSEVSMHKESVNLDLDIDAYMSLEDSGVLKVITARDDNGTLVGYCSMLIMPHLHYKNDIFAFNDGIYISPRYRNGFVGIRLLKESERVMKDNGVSVMTVHVKPTKDFSPVLKRIGFSEFETVYSKYIGVE